MNFQRILIPVLGLAALGLAWRHYGWSGVALVGGGIVMWALLHVTRLMTVMRRAAERPIGHVASAVMLNARLRPGLTLMHVVAMTRALGQLQSPKDTQPELYRWTDAGESFVTAEFQNGKLVRWELTRPAAPQPEAAAPPPAAS